MLVFLEVNSLLTVVLITSIRFVIYIKRFRYL